MRGLWSFLYFSFVHDSIPYLCTVTNDVKKILLRRALGTPIFQFGQFLTPPVIIPVYTPAGWHRLPLLCNLILTCCFVIQPDFAVVCSFKNTLIGIVNHWYLHR